MSSILEVCLLAPLAPRRGKILFFNVLAPKPVLV
jgi:hypothetical protein